MECKAVQCSAVLGELQLLAIVYPESREYNVQKDPGASLNK